MGYLLRRISRVLLLHRLAQNEKVQVAWRVVKAWYGRQPKKLQIAVGTLILLAAAATVLT